VKRAGPRRRPSLGQHDSRARSCRRPARPPIAHPFLRAASDAFRRAIYEERNGKILPELWQFIDGEARTRATRSQLLESICLIVECLLSRSRIKCGRVGHRRKTLRRGRKNDFVGLPIFVVMQWTGLSMSTVSHVLTLLRRSGLVHGPSRGDKVNHISQPCERQADGTFEWLTAVRRVNFLFFAGLGCGLGTWLGKLREGPPKPATATAPSVDSVSARKIVAALAASHAIADPPDS
jgi:DNA-binding transcriptional ArsR family regulator